LNHQTPQELERKILEAALNWYATRLVGADSKQASRQFWDATCRFFYVHEHLLKKNDPEDAW